MLLKGKNPDHCLCSKLKKERKKEKGDPMTQFFVTFNMRVYNNVLF